MPRSFLALDLDAAFLAGTANLVEKLRQERELSHARWVKSSVMHVTIRFLGETEDSLVPALGELVSTLAEDVVLRGEGKALDLSATSLLAFPKERRAHILALRIDDGGFLLRLAEDAESAVLAMGFPPDRHGFHPHLTLARIKEPPADLRRLMATSEVEITGRAAALTLYKSELGANGPTYTPLTRYAF